MSDAAADAAEAAIRFDVDVARGGYAWWYVDALSDDGRRGLTLIAFVGSVFSPYYAWARRRDPLADPGEHVALNVALYGADGRRWAMTERGASHAERTARSCAIGPSRLDWDGVALTVTIDEVCAPWPQHVHGRVRVVPRALHAERHPLDAAGRHHWQPIAPVADVEVDLDAPGSRWRGHAYVDRNQGDAALEHDFRRWHWSRGRTARGRTGIVYDIERCDGSARSLALAFDADGRSLGAFDPPPVVALPRSGWRIDRTTRSEGDARIERRLEDGPFYARSVVRSALLGEPAVAVHESLDLRRFASPWVQAMLPFRMPRRG